MSEVEQIQFELDQVVQRMEVDAETAVYLTDQLHRVKRQQQELLQRREADAAQRDTLQERIEQSNQ